MDFKLDLQLFLEKFEETFLALEDDSFSFFTKRRSQSKKTGPKSTLESDLDMETCCFHVANVL